MYNVLIADDNPVICESLAKTIPWEKLKCETPFMVFDGDMAKIEIEDRKPDIIISDIRMPGIDGLKLLAWSKETNPDRPFIIITGFDDFDYARKALRLGALDLIIKPISNAELSDAVMRAVQKLEEKYRVTGKLKKLQDRVNMGREELKTVSSERRIKLYRDLLFGESPDRSVNASANNTLQEIGGFPKNTSFRFRMGYFPVQEEQDAVRNKVDQIRTKLLYHYSLYTDFFKIHDCYCLIAFITDIRNSAYLEGMESFFTLMEEKEGSRGHLDPPPRQPVFSGPFDDISEIKPILDALHKKAMLAVEIRGPAEARRLPRFSPQVAAVLRYMLANHDQKLSLDDVAEEMQLCGTHITRILKKESGYGFVDVLSRFRIAAALELLKAGRLRVYEVGDKVGLENYAYFYQVFKKITGYAPKEFPYNDRELYEELTAVLRWLE